MKRGEKVSGLFFVIILTFISIQGTLHPSTSKPEEKKNNDTQNPK